MSESPFDIIVIGSGPAGQKAAICGAKAKRRVLIIEGEQEVGGACVHRGTIPSKTLRETALSFAAFKRRTGGVMSVQFPEDMQVASLMTRLSRWSRRTRASSPSSCSATASPTGTAALPSPRRTRSRSARWTARFAAPAPR